MGTSFLTTHRLRHISKNNLEKGVSSVLQRHVSGLSRRKAVANGRSALIHRNAVAIVFIVCSVMFFSSPVSAVAMAHSFPDVSGCCNSCESEPQPDDNDYSSHCSLCNACCCLIFQKHRLINIYNHSTRKFIPPSEQLNTNELISSIFKPPKS